MKNMIRVILIIVFMPFVIIGALGAIAASGLVIGFHATIEFMVSLKS